MKKAQETMITMVVGLAIVFVLIMGATIFFKLFFEGEKIEDIERQESKAVEIATHVSRLPELRCSRNNVAVANCINLQKAGVLSNTGFMNKPETRAYYHSLLGFSRISIQQEYIPECSDGIDNNGNGIIDGTDSGECPSKSTAPLVIYDRPPDKYKRKFSITHTRMIYDPTQSGNCFALGKGTCEYGYITIETFA